MRHVISPIKFCEELCFWTNNKKVLKVLTFSTLKCTFETIHYQFDSELSKTFQ